MYVCIYIYIYDTIHDRLCLQNQTVKYVHT